METQRDPALERTVRAYGERLNATDIPGIVALFTEDGVLMQPDAPTAVGREQLKAAYEYGLGQMHVNPMFSFDQFLVESDLAVVRTRTQVSVTLVATGEPQSLTGRELFVLRREDGEWKIAHYMFQHTPAA